MFLIGPFNTWEIFLVIKKGKFVICILLCRTFYGKTPVDGKRNKVKEDENDPFKLLSQKHVFAYFLFIVSKKVVNLGPIA